MKGPRHSIRDLLRTGLFSCAEIASQLGVSRGRVYQVAAQERAHADLRDQQQAEASLPFRERRLACLPMSVRLRNACLNVNPDTRNPYHPAWHPPTPTLTFVGDLLQWTAADLLMLKNFGRLCVNEVRELLIANGVTPPARFDAPWSPSTAPARPVAPPPPRVIVVLPTARGTH